jgi:hypothetical protein
MDKFGGFDKCSCIVMDGAQAMVGHHTGSSGLLKKRDKLFYSSLHYSSGIIVWLSNKTEQFHENCGNSNKSNSRWQ